MSRMTVTYHVKSEASLIDARARAIAVEQSVEMPIEAITHAHVLSDIVGEVHNVRELAPEHYEVKVGLAVDTVGGEAGQFLNIAFGNTSLHDNVTLADIDVPEKLARSFGGPNLGIEGLRAQAGAPKRALTCTALKPQGMSVPQLAELAGKLARGGLDYIKDDHNLANQSYSPAAWRIPACAEAVAKANAETGFRTRYVPNISGDLDQMRAQLKLSVASSVDAVMIEPMIAGFANYHRLVKEFPTVAFFGHPSMAGGRIAPPLMFGKLFRLFGSDVTIYTNYGGRFAYAPETCKRIADEMREDFAGLKGSMPSPAGGMTLDRVGELLDFYGPDTMLLIGGSLLLAKENMTQEAAAFCARVAKHFE